ncbi:MAG: hypothetical protein A3K10_14875 [Bacteroidetes bacterium RIFCSPLOWO2_12_FULL_31_6]|nr:MAG: hypothetical protein A3K10_14875 [Bacteroidetes bacterium RIFCSPLOWO2_12_FULL_31_6]
MNTKSHEYNNLKYIMMSKKLTYFFVLISILSGAIFSCNGTDETINVVEYPELKGFEELDLSQWGFNLTVMVPNKELNGDPQVTLTERGALEVVVGADFGLEIMYGEGDIELLKMDLKEDLVFTSEITKEDSVSIIYTQDIPNSGVKTQNHFLYKAVVGTDIYEVRDVIDGEYGSGMIEIMLNASRTLKANKVQEAV